MRKSNEINNLKKISHKSIQKDDLCKKYFYKLNLSPKKNNIFQLMENGLSNQDDLEQVDNVCTKLQKQKNELEKKQCGNSWKRIQIDDTLSYQKNIEKT